jgi:hypothetical protein
LRVKKLSDGALVLEGDLDEETDEAFVEGRIIEAFELIHAYIHWLMKDLFKIYRSIDLGENVRELEATIRENPSWQDSLNRLFENEIITKEEFSRLRDINELKNKIVRWLILPPAYQSRKEKVTRDEAFEGYMEAKEMIFLLKGRSKSMTRKSHSWYDDETDHMLLG